MAVDNGIDFLPWYAAGEQMLRCSGNHGCGALIMSDDVELHIKFHNDLLSALNSVFGALSRIVGLTP